MKIQHTPGPWTIHKCPCGDKVCNQHTISVQGSVGFDETDARLIAAAPELLDACRAALLRDDVADCELGDVLRAAVAKAVGEA